jgi:hypothetical protein
MGMMRVMVLRGAVGVGVVLSGAGLVAAGLSAATAPNASRGAATTEESVVNAKGLELLDELMKLRGKTISRVSSGRGTGTSRYDREGVLPDVFAEHLPSHPVEFAFRGDDYLVKEFDPTDGKVVTATFLKEGSGAVIFLWGGGGARAWRGGARAGRGFPPKAKPVRGGLHRGEGVATQQALVVPGEQRRGGVLGG